MSGALDGRGEPPLQSQPLELRIPTVSVVNVSTTFVVAETSHAMSVRNIGKGRLTKPVDDHRIGVTLDALQL